MPVCNLSYRGKVPQPGSATDALECRKNKIAICSEKLTQLPGAEGEENRNLS